MYLYCENGVHCIFTGLYIGIMEYSVSILGEWSTLHLYLEYILGENEVHCIYTWSIYWKNGVHCIYSGVYFGRMEYTISILEYILEEWSTLYL